MIFESTEENERAVSLRSRQLPTDRPTMSVTKTATRSNGQDSWTAY